MDIFTIPPNNPALAGHFPDNPIVPGVVILDHVIAKANQHTDKSIKGIKKAKFVQVLRADEAVIVEYGSPSETQLRFKCRKQKDNSALMEGNLIIE